MTPAVQKVKRIGAGWTVLVVDDEDSLRHVLRVILEQAGFEVAEATDGQDALDVLEADPSIGIVLCDIRMPRMDGMALLEQIQGRDLKVVMMSAYGTTQTAVEALGCGAQDYISKPFRPDEIRVCLGRLVERERLVSENRRLRAVVGDHATIEGFVGRSDAARAVIELVEKVAAYPSTVLITGESGTGKEVLARGLHSRSPRCDGPFVAVNCAAIPENLLESELFGHERGAFTGAIRTHAGLFEQADGGTLLLDEIGDMPKALQTRLLRVLEESSIRRIGGSKDLPIDVRVVAATAHDLDQKVADGTFREDVLYRLKVVHICVPPLRDRIDDLPILVDTLIARTAERLGREPPTMDDEAHQLLAAYPWPGNVRELENALERGMLMGDGSTIGVDDLPQEMRTRATAKALDLAGDDLSIKRHTANLERLLIGRALKETGGNRSRAARLLDISYKALVYKIRGYGLGD